jgi:outer membrane protein assembly factor BamA
VLYTGVKHFDINTPEGVTLPSDLRSELSQSINVKPNNPLYSPYVRTPFPIGLWVYNNWNDSSSGIKGWLYRKLVAQPVLISDVKPEVRTQMLQETLKDNGYFGATVSYELAYDKHNSKKARVNYLVNTGEPYPIDSVIYINHTDDAICQFIDSVARKNSYLQPGNIFCVDSLDAVRTTITNRMRNRGFYYFSPEYIEFLADSTISKHKIAVKITLSANTPRMATLQYRTGKIQTTLLRQDTKNPGTPDTLNTSKGDVIVMRPAHVRENLIPSCITFRNKKLFSVRDMDRTQLRLSRLGIFSSIEIQPIPADTTAANPTMDLYITCRYDQPMQASLEMNVASKSNSYIGPGLTASLSHNNIFGGAEKLTFALNANYEWQTGRNASSLFNSYEFGINTSLAFPRLLAPAFIKRTQREINWTKINIGASVLNRPHYFRMSQFNTGIQYDWQTTRNVSHSFTPFKLTYTKLDRTTAAFDSIMSENPAIALSFQNQFIPELSYSYTLDKYLEREKINGINFNVEVTEAGNLFSGIWRLCGDKGEKKLFGTPFSQFVKAQAQLIYSRRLVEGTSHWLVTRFLIGAEHAYGNSSEVPYSEQFYIGGANSIRAFTVRSLGPGSYHAASDNVNGYFDQTGTFKLEMNAEYRFPLFGDFYGAAFLDAGNIWLLKDDPQRPGGKITGKDFLRDVAVGTGVGIRYDMGMIVVRADLGYGLHAPYADYSRHYFNIPLRDAFAFRLALGYPF